jgi:putative DNA primase/helicase
MANTPLPDINFAALAKALADRADDLVEQWLPGGKFDGVEYVVHSVWRSEKTASLKVRVRGNSAEVGRWADFGGDKRGNDLVSLYAEIHALSPGKAAAQLARDYHLEREANIVSRASGPPVPAPPTPTPAPAVKTSARARGEGEQWSVIAPVPPLATEPTFWHFARKERPQHIARYERDGELFGFVVRWLTSDGGKETLPYTWCRSDRDGSCKWHWKVWDEPRPLYLPNRQAPGARTVVLVEGERKADMLQELLDAGAAGVYVVVGWQGGSKAWKKADWSWLARCGVLLWPDCDGKREKLTREEEISCCGDELAIATARASKPLLPVEKQVGMAAMLGIGAMLRDVHECSVQLLPIPQPGDAPDGWDCADAIATDGWDFARVMEFFASAFVLPVVDARPRDKPKKSSTSADRDGSASAGGMGDEFENHLAFMAEQLDCEVHELAVNRKLLIAALRKAPDLVPCLGFNELVCAPSTRTPWPWRSEAGPLKDSDDLRFGDFLSTRYKLKPASRAALAESIDTVADERRFHPIRDWLEGLEWDGKPRLDKWLMFTLDIAIDTLSQRRRAYFEMIGRFWLVGMVARVMDPGCKFDYSLVLEGRTGRRKSTFFKTLAGKQYFSDTHFDIGTGKDGFEQLEGLWVYELSELTALRKADSEQVKQFFSSEVDRFRGAYGRFVQPHPRQCVIGCSTNKRVYLYDLTGNRRFWPIWVETPIKIEWLAKWRGQLFAEALAKYRAGEPYSPTLDEEEKYFVPEQNLRLVETAVQSRLYELLTREGASKGDARTTAGLSQLTAFVTLDQLVNALGSDAAKSTSILEGQIRGWLESMGWEYGREGGGQRRRGYKQPRTWPPKVEEDDEDVRRASDLQDDRQAQAGDEEGDDDLPF